MKNFKDFKCKQTNIIRTLKDALMRIQKKNRLISVEIGIIQPGGGNVSGQRDILSDRFISHLSVLVFE